MSRETRRGLMTTFTRKSANNDVDDWRTPISSGKSVDKKNAMPLFFVEKETNPPKSVVNIMDHQGWMSSAGKPDIPIFMKQALDELDHLPFFQRHMSKSEANHILRHPQLSAGAYLLRSKAGSEGELEIILSMLAPNNEIIHLTVSYKIHNKFTVCSLDGFNTLFMNMKELLNYYKLNSGLVCKLDVVAQKSMLL